MEVSGQFHAPASLPPGEEPPVCKHFDPNNRVGTAIKLCYAFFNEHHTMKAYWANGGLAPRILRPQH